MERRGQEQPTLFVERYVLVPLVIVLLAVLLWRYEEKVIGEQSPTYIGLKQAVADHAAAAHVKHEAGGKE